MTRLLLLLSLLPVHAAITSAPDADPPPAQERTAGVEPEAPPSGTPPEQGSDEPAEPDEEARQPSEEEDEEAESIRHVRFLREEFPPGTQGLTLFWTRVEREDLTDLQLADMRLRMEADIERLRAAGPQAAAADPAIRARLSDYRDWAPLLDSGSVEFLETALGADLPETVPTLAFTSWSAGEEPWTYTSASASDVEDEVEEGAGEEEAGRTLPEGFQIGRVQSIQQGPVDMSSPQPHQNPNAMESAITVHAGSGRGSGVIVWSDSQNTFALTAGHVTDSHRQVQIVHQGRTYNATVVSTYGTNPDIALLRIHTGGQELPFTLPAREDPRPGENVVFIGQRYYETQLTPKGAVVQGQRQFVGGRFADIVIQPRPVSGDSGGPLIDQDNCVAGICNSAEVYGPNGYFASVDAIHAILRNNGLQWLYDGTLDQPRELARDFTFVGSDGQTHALSSFRGQTPALIQLSADWCGHCHTAADRLLPALRGMTGGQDVPVIVVLPHDTTEETARQYALRHNLPAHGVHLIIDGEGANSVAAQFSPGEAPGYPSFFLVDRDGGVAWAESGYNASIHNQLLSRLTRATQPGGFARQEFDRLFDGAQQGPFMAGGPGSGGPGGSCGPGGCGPGAFGPGGPGGSCGPGGCGPSSAGGGPTVPTSAPPEDPPDPAQEDAGSEEGGGGCAVPRGGGGAGGPGFWLLALILARLGSPRRPKALPLLLAAALLAPAARAAEPSGSSAPTDSPSATTGSPTGTDPAPSGADPQPTAAPESPTPGQEPEPEEPPRPEVHPRVDELRDEQEADPSLAFPPREVNLPDGFSDYISQRYPDYSLQDLSPDERLSLIKETIDDDVRRMTSAAESLGSPRRLPQADKDLLRYYRGAWAPLFGEDQRRFADAALGAGSSFRLASMNPLALFGSGLRDAVGAARFPGAVPGRYPPAGEDLPGPSGRRGSTGDFIQRDPSSGIGYVEAGRFDDFLQQASREGKTVLLDFSGTWCPHCKPAQGPLHDLQERYGEEGLLVVGVFNDSREDLNGPAGRSFFGGEAPNYAVVADEDGDLARRHNVSSYPSFQLIGPDGRAAGGPRTGTDGLLAMMREDLPAALASRPRAEGAPERRPETGPQESPRPPPNPRYTTGRITTPRGTGGGAAIGSGVVLESRVMTGPDGREIRRLIVASAGHVQAPQGGPGGGRSIPDDSPPNDSNWPRNLPGREPAADGSYTIDLLVRGAEGGEDRVMTFTGGRPLYQGFSPSADGLGEDRALLQFDVPADVEVPASPLARGGVMPAGSTLHLYGFPGGQYGEKTVTTTRDVDIAQFMNKFITSTGGPTSGYSGGPVMNADGEVLGICTNAQCDPANPDRVIGGVYSALGGPLGVRDMLRRTGLARLIPGEDPSAPPQEEQGGSHGGFQEQPGPMFDGSGPHARGPHGFQPGPGQTPGFQGGSCGPQGCPSPQGGLPGQGSCGPQGCPSPQGGAPSPQGGLPGQGSCGPQGCPGSAGSMFDGSGGQGSCGPGGCGPSGGQTVPTSSPPPAERPQEPPAEPEEEEQPQEPPPPAQEKKGGGCAVPAGGGGAGGPGLWLGALLAARLNSLRRRRRSA